MAKPEFFLLVILSLSFALIDPPVHEVHDYNVGIAPQTVLSSNVLQQSVHTPALNDPTTFIYISALTLTPSVNETVTAKYHPQLIWLVAEYHVPSITEINGVSQYDQDVTFTEPTIIWVVQESESSGPLSAVEFDEDGNMEILYYGSDVELVPQIIYTAPTIEEPEMPEGCEKTVITRNYDDLQIESVSAYYTLRGVLYNDSGQYSYLNVTDSTLLANNEIITNPADVPFKQSLSCSFLAFVNEYIFGDMFDLDCNDESLARASPYAVGTYNATVRNLTIVNPTLEVTLTGSFSIFYEEHGQSCYETEEGCECGEPWDTNGTIPYTRSDFAVYEVQNDYISLLPYSPAFLNLSANTSEDVIYYSTLLTNSELYKYYSKMDGNLSSAYYLHNFTVETDGYGIKHIVAEDLNHEGILPEDPLSGTNYTGPRRLLIYEFGNDLRSPTEVNVQKYNYSKSYTFKEVFYNLSPGEHDADLMFYTWWGEHIAHSDIYARNSTFLTLSAFQSGDEQVTATCRLANKDGSPVPGALITLNLGEQISQTTTDSNGVCTALFDFNESVTTIEAQFAGTDTHMPADVSFMISIHRPFSLGTLDIPFGVLVLFSLLLGIVFLNMTSALGNIGGHGALGLVSSKMFPFLPKGVQVKKSIRVKKGKELAIYDAMAAAGGAAAGSKIAGEAAKKKMTQEAAKKSGKKAVAAAKKKKADEKLTKAAYDEKKKRAQSDEMEKGKKKMAAGGPPPGDDPKKRNEMVKKQINSRLAAIYQKAQTACKNLGHSEWMDRYLEKNITFRDKTTRIERTYRLKIGKVETKVVKNFDSATDYALTHVKRQGPEVQYLVCLRGDRLANLSTFLPDANHEVLHTRNKLNEGRCGNQVEGANEVMSYQDSIGDLNSMEVQERNALLDLSEPADIKSEKLESLKTKYEGLRHDVCIAPGIYRQYAVPQFLLKQIIGEDNFNAGHLVVGQEHLKKAFDRIAGDGEYEKIFGVQKDKLSGEWSDKMSDEKKLDAVMDIIEHKYKDNPEFIRNIENQVRNIIEKGRYDVE